MAYPSSSTRTAATAINLLLPWAAFLAVLAWAWRVGDLFHNLPAYGDALEVTWGLEWYGHSLAHGLNPLFSPTVFAPQGWQVATLAHGPALFLALLPLYALGGAAFAFNFGGLTAHVLAFGGTFKMARLWLGPLGSTLAALAFTFWSYRWFRTIGHLHTLFSTAMLPLEVWAWEMARRQPRRRRRWYVLTGIFWALSILASLYAIWHSLVLMLVWALAERAAGQIKWKALAEGLLTAGSTALALSSPMLWLFWRAISTSVTRFNDIQGLIHWGASINSLTIPSPMHPWLRPAALFLDHGPFDESELANFGLAISLTALAGFIAFRKDRRLRPLLACALVGLVLALGPALKINGDIQTASWLEPFDSALWSFEHQIKPQLFPQAQPPGKLVDAIPLPDMLVALLPLWEGGRVSSRFALVAALGIFPAMGWAVERLKPGWLRAALALALVFELLPPPTSSVPAQPPTHPAFAWLAAQDLAGQNIIDLSSGQPDHLSVMADGKIAFATLYEHQSTVSGLGSYLPAHFQFLASWFEAVAHPLLNHDLAALMRFYNVRYLLVHMDSNLLQAVADDSRANAELRFVQCFDPPPGVSPWSVRMCIIEVLPAPNARFNLIERSGWSADEPWGTWIGGTTATADWVATASAAQSLAIALVPLCLPGRPQHVTLLVNGEAIADHTWDNCDPWSATIKVPANAVQIGWDQLTIRAYLVGQPVDLATGKVIDTRQLSVAVTQLILTP